MTIGTAPGDTSPSTVSPPRARPPRRPPTFRAVVLGLSQLPSVRRLVTRGGLMRRAVGRFVAGETLDDALRVATVLNARGLHAMLDYLGEATEHEDAARRAARVYGETLAAIEGRRLRRFVSVKLSQLGLDVSAPLAETLLHDLADRAADAGLVVEVDMEDSARLPMIQRVFDRVWESGAHNLGIALQAYLYRSAADAGRYLARGVRVRLCKGAYAEPPDVAYPRRRDVDRAFTRLIERLLGGAGTLAVATHDERLIRHAKALAAERRVPVDRFEFQMLYGIRADLQEALARQGYVVRVYVPYGSHWYPYFMRRLAERPANLLFIARHLLRQ